MWWLASKKSWQRLSAKLGVTKSLTGMRWEVLGDRSSRGRESLHYAVLDCPWLLLCLIVMASYLVVALLFMGIFIAMAAAGEGELLLSSDTYTLVQAEMAWRMSVAAVLTLGYGDVFPSSLGLLMVVTIEQFIGAVMSAFLVSIILTKASTPNARLRFSSSALLGVKRGGARHLVLRMASLRGDFLLVPDVCLSYVTTDPDGRFTSGKPLAYSPPPIFSPVPTIAHEIDSSSPLYGKTLHDIAAEGGHIVVCISVVDSIYMQQMYAHRLYQPQDLVEGHEFAEACMTRGGRQFVDLASLDVLLPVEKEDPAAGAQRAKQPGGGAGSSRSSSDAQQGQHQQQQKKQQHVPPEASGASVCEGVTVCTEK